MSVHAVENRVLGERVRNKTALNSFVDLFSSVQSNQVCHFFIATCSFLDNVSEHIPEVVNCRSDRHRVKAHEWAVSEQGAAVSPTCIYYSVYSRAKPVYMEELPLQLGVTNQASKSWEGRSTVRLLDQLDNSQQKVSFFSGYLTLHQHVSTEGQSVVVELLLESGPREQEVQTAGTREMYLFAGTRVTK